MRLVTFDQLLERVEQLEIAVAYLEANESARAEQASANYDAKMARYEKEKAYWHQLGLRGEEGSPPIPPAKLCDHPSCSNKEPHYKSRHK